MTLLVIACQVSVAQETVTALRESKFEDAINRPLIAVGERARLRDYLNRLAEERQAAILLDRRIDPGQLINVQISSDFFDDGIASFVAQAGCGVCVLADTIYVGPTETTKRLRTRVAVSRQQLDDVPTITPRRQFELLRRYPLSWEMLASPREILSELTTKYHVKIENVDAIPHDLWAAGTVSYPNLIEGLTIVLTQFQLSFEWVDDSTIRLVPEPPEVVIEDEHRPKGMSFDEATETLAAKFPNRKLERRGVHIVFAGTIEEHEQAAILIGERPARRRAATPVTGQSLRDRRFTLKMVRKPFGSLLATLQQQGIEVRYEPAELEAAGIDLAEKISLELEQATIDQLLQQSCEKVGLRYVLQGNIIILKVPMDR